MRAWALLALLLFAAAAAGEEDVFASWERTLESLRSVVGDEVPQGLERAASLKEAILAQERALSKLRPKLETLGVGRSEEGFGERLEQEFSSVMEKLASLGLVERSAPAVQSAVRPEQWMRIAESLRESWSAKLAAKEVGERLKRVEGKDVPAESIWEIERVTDIFAMKGKFTEITDCLKRFKEGKMTKEELRACMVKAEPQPIPDKERRGEVPPPGVGTQPAEGVSFKLALTGSGVKLEPERVELKVTGSASGFASFKDVAKLQADGAPVIFKVSPTISGEVRGHIAVVLRGEGGEQYMIGMPCAIATTSCYRIMVLIPGYDVPIQLAPGKYSVDIGVKWEAKDGGASGSIEIVVAATYSK